MTAETLFPFLPDAVFLDRDGTIIVDKHYLCQPDEVELLPGAGEALALFSRAGCKLFVVTNQSGIGRGMFTQDDYEACRLRMDELLKAFGVTIHDSRYCPHVPSDDSHPACHCRKPQIGMWSNLRAVYNLDPQRCVMIGDKLSDVMFGINAGFNASFLVLTGDGPTDAARWGISLPKGKDTAAINIPCAVLPATENTLETEQFLSRDLLSIAKSITGL